LVAHIHLVEEQNHPIQVNIIFKIYRYITELLVIDNFILVDLIYCRYHQPSILLSPSLNLQKAGDMAAEFSVVVLY
jgi:hypothetical protein